MPDSEGVEDSADAVPCGDCHDARYRRWPKVLFGLPSGRAHGSAHPELLLDLLEQVGDTDLARTTGVDTRLHGGADVIGVDVTVPDTLATDHDDRVADARPDVLEVRHRLVGGFEEVHDLVAQVAQVGLPVRTVGCRAARSDGVVLA